MGSPSFVLKGQLGAARDTFASACHGAGRLLSRAAAMKSAKGRRIADELAKKGIIVRATGRTTLAEEIPQAYKDASEVVEVVHTAGIAAKVAWMCPLGVVRGWGRDRATGAGQGQHLPYEAEADIPAAHIWGVADAVSRP